MQLRQWQLECVNRALEHFHANKRHFLCLATPGAGKTIMAAEIAAELFEQDLIDFVLCFSPSVNISQGIQNTFSHRLECRFDGVIGAVGCSYTYQGMLSFKDDFWQLLKRNRVLVIFDEIHHCSGSTLEDANAWGEEILLNIQDHAKYTLALTGTPWRSDQAPIVLSRYLDPDSKIQCDYVYGLREAVRDGVCRNPKIVLIDNEELLVTNQDNEIQTFSSFDDLFKGSSISYQSVVKNNLAIHHILGLAIDKLGSIRQLNPNAAGLVVASSIEHASHILKILKDTFHQTATIVTYQEANPSDIINEFRHDNTQWIVSVGMVSEGTDIPRLQVCCHLSRVKTELYFRQILGRILRTTRALDQQAWLFMFAEPKLVVFAHRIELELPDNHVVMRESKPSGGMELTISNYEKKPSHLPNQSRSFTLSVGDIFDKKQTNAILNRTTEDVQFTSSINLSIEILGRFREKVISTFDSPF
ncbi:DEAD/DEAH box helicase family protein [Shewanella schlegeliana]|uniref:DEAD/DEAH box helicase family protein n=1 Tax=Shewanella schlegeliana TaxID=190308 RepID=A0ABS1T3K7_9GAMM|nr:DEAD/DEAH box helicase family protein [Shewanella schlegeliana]MBL4914734.1 DEAD/DEAH box helicase family protein [Shewanella schlegeliana]MCL1109934.1 DEAD/DEAH box helicase family protein [Shewanella schlegeliana]GIU25582.1 diguanylate cyclase [Shewanella schlegeliana]